MTISLNAYAYRNFKAVIGGNYSWDAWYGVSILVNGVWVEQWVHETGTIPPDQLTFGGIPGYYFLDPSGYEIVGNGQDNDLYGSDGIDRLFGGAGKDDLSGRDGDDRLFGGDDDDGLWGADGNDFLRGDAGDDYILGENTSHGDGDHGGNDTINGGAGNDYIYGDWVYDIWHIGLAGYGTGIGYGGDDSILGGAGDDYIYGCTGDDTIDGGSGRDTAVYFGLPTDFIIHQAAGQPTTVLDKRNGDLDVIKGVERVLFKPQLYEWYWPGAGASVAAKNVHLELAKIALDVYRDPVSAQNAIDPGWHRLSAGEIGLAESSSKWIFDDGVFHHGLGGAAEVLAADWNGQKVMVLSFAGTDSLLDVVGWTPSQVSAYFALFKPLMEAFEQASSDADVIYITGHSLGGGMASMAIEKYNFFTDAKVVTFGGMGINSRLDWGDSRQVHYAHYNDPVGHLFEHPGSDIELYTERRSPLSAHSMVGYVDSIRNLQQLPGSERPFYDPAFNEVIDRHLAVGDPLADVIYGTNDDVAETLYGFAGEDVIYGRGGADKIHGGADDDDLSGGAAADNLWGDAGRDYFIYGSWRDSTATAFDVIRDFRHNEDKIDLRLIDANGISRDNKNDDFTFFAQSSSTFGGTRGELRWYRVDNANDAKDKTIIIGDVDGNREADLFITLQGLHALRAADFIL